MKLQKRSPSIFKHLVVAGLTIALPLLDSSTFAETLIYDGDSGTGKVTIVSASKHELDTLPWLEIADNAQGVLPLNRNNILSLDVNLIVDYSSGAVPEFIMGGYMASSEFSVEDNTVRVLGGAIDGPVYGGLSHTTAMDIGFRPASSTALAVSSISIADANNVSERNSVFLSQSSDVNGNVYGGAAVLWAQAHDVTSHWDNLYGSAYAITEVKNSSVVADANTVMLEEQASMIGNIHGGLARMSVQASFANASENYKTNLSIAQVESKAENVKSLAENNVVILERNSTLQGSIYGGSALFESMATDAKGNQANNSGGNGLVWAEAKAYNNAFVAARLNIVELGEGSSMVGVVYGGYSEVKAFSYRALGGGGFGLGEGASNAITSSSSYSHVMADENVVLLKQDSDVTGDIYGGSGNFSVTSGYARQGSLTGGGRDGGAGGPTYVGVDLSGSIVQAVGNIISLEQGSSVTGNIFGGHATRNISGYDGPDIRMSAQGSRLLASENKVIVDGKVSGSAIYGGYVKSQINYSAGPVTVADFSGSRAEAIENTVTIGAHAELGANTHVFGGFVTTEGSDFEPEFIDAVTGNTLEFHASGMTLAGVSNFENYTFHVTENAIEDVALLTIAATPLQLYGSGEHIIDFTDSGSILATLSSLNILAAEAGLADGSDIVLWNVRGAERWGMSSDDFTIGWNDNILSVTWMPIPEPGSYIAFVALSVVGLTLMQQRRRSLL